MSLTQRQKRPQWTIPEREAVISYEPVTNADLRRWKQPGIKRKFLPVWTLGGQILTGRKQSFGVG